MTDSFNIRLARPPLTVVGDEGVKVPAEVLRELDEAVEWKWIMGEEGWSRRLVLRERDGKGGWTETLLTYDAADPMPVRCPKCQRFTPCPSHPESEA